VNVIVVIIRRKPVLTYASIIFGDMLASVNSVNSGVIHIAISDLSTAISRKRCKI